MMSWVTQEMQGTQMPDERLYKRLEKLLTSLSKNGEQINGVSRSMGSESLKFLRQKVIDDTDPIDPWL